MTIAPTPVQRSDHDSVRLILAVTVVVLTAAAVVALLVRYDVIGGISVSSGVSGSGVALIQTRAVSPFSGVELAGSNNVVIRVGGKQSVTVHADDNLVGRVTTDVLAGRLVIGNTTGSFTTKSPMSVVVSVPSLDAVALTGSGLVTATGLTAERLTLTLSGSGVLRAVGTATRLDITLGGSGDAQLSELVAKDVHAVVSGSGRILLTATSSLDASIPGSGVITYRGDPAHVTSNVTGSGTVIRG
jgi:putative autotransporter adhesin-like protein